MPDLVSNEPSWLTARRTRAADLASNLELPSFKGTLGWEFTDLSALDIDSYEPAEPAEVWNGEAGQLFEGLEHGLSLTQVDAASAEVDGLPDSPDEPLAMPLDAAAERFPELVERHLGTVVSDDDPFVARNQRSWSGGAFVYVPAGKRLEAPALITALQGQPGTGLEWRTLIVLEEGAEAEVWESTSRVHRPLSLPFLSLQYLYSHAENDGSVGGGESNAPQNVACRKCDWGPSVFDVRHNIVGSVVYALPFGKGQQFATSGFASVLLGGWTLSGMNLWHTGHPLDVTLDIPASFVPDGNNSNTRPDVVPGVSVIPAGQGVNNWVNPAAFMAPPTDANGNLLRFGNAGRGLVRAPITWQTDISLARTFKLTERVGLEFTAQAFNIFNHDQYADPNNLSLTYNPPDATHAQGYITVPAGFGQITSIANFNSNSDKFAVDNTGSGLPRELQFAVRVTF